jgi:hypothetical protein
MHRGSVGERYISMVSGRCITNDREVMRVNIIIDRELGSVHCQFYNEPKDSYVEVEIGGK